MAKEAGDGHGKKNAYLEGICSNTTCVVTGKLLQGYPVSRAPMIHPTLVPDVRAVGKVCFLFRFASTPPAVRYRIVLCVRVQCSFTDFFPIRCICGYVYGCVRLVLSNLIAKPIPTAAQQGCRQMIICCEQNDTEYTERLVAAQNA